MLTANATKGCPGRRQPVLILRLAGAIALPVGKWVVRPEIYSWQGAGGKAGDIPIVLKIRCR